MPPQGEFRKRLFADLLIRAQGNRSITQFAKEVAVSAAHISRLTRCLLDSPPSPKTIRKMAEKAMNGVTYKDLMDAAGYLAIIDESRFNDVFPKATKEGEDLGSVVSRIVTHLSSEEKFDLLYYLLSETPVKPDKNLFERAIEFIKNEEGTTTENFFPLVTKTSFLEKLLGVNDSPKCIPFFRLPILRKINNGVPFHENFLQYLEMPDNINADFCIQARDDSMIGSGILAGDYAVCRQTNESNSGDIAVAINGGSLDFSEPILRYVVVQSDERILRAANPAYSDIKLMDEQRIIGKMEAIIRLESPGYHIYEKYLNIPANEDWLDLIELARSLGLSFSQVKQIIKAQIEIARRLKD